VLASGEHQLALSSPPAFEGGTPSCEAQLTEQKDEPSSRRFDAGAFKLDATQAELRTANRTLAYQKDGNVVLYGYPTDAAGERQYGADRQQALWASDTRSPYGELRFQADGNLVLYSANGVVVWTSGTAGHPGATLRLQADGNLVIYSAQGRPLWSTGSHDRLP
jgi:hypothetical protein